MMKVNPFKKTLLLGGFFFVSAALASEENLPDLFEKVQSSVVNISSTTVVNYSGLGMWQEFFQHWGIPLEHKQSSLGSGFILDKDGYVITNKHVVDQASELEIALSDKRRFNGRIVGVDSKTDIALVQIFDKTKKIPTNIQPAVLGDSDKVRTAETVLAIGNPFGLQNSVSRGIISAKNRTIGMGPFDNFLQTDAAINPGNSGGPLFNTKGEVIGINNLIYSRVGQSGGLGFAIPINMVKTIVDDLKRFGRVPRPWLGIVSQQITPPVQRSYRLSRSDGLLIYNLVQGGPADKAGLQPGDILYEVNGKKIQDQDEAERVISQFKPTDKIDARIDRKGKEKKVTIQFRDLPAKVKELPQEVI